MIALCKKDEDGYVSAWVHPRCLFAYRRPPHSSSRLHRASTGGESKERNLTMLDTTPITAQITRLIATGTTEQATARRRGAYVPRV